MSDRTAERWCVFGFIVIAWFASLKELHNYETYTDPPTQSLGVVLDIRPAIDDGKRVATVCCSGEWIAVRGFPGGDGPVRVYRCGDVVTFHYSDGRSQSFKELR